MSMGVGRRGLISTLRRLAGALRIRHRRWAGRRHAQLHSFIGLSDRALADIGLRRADVHAAMSGMMPVEHIARAQGSPAWTADIHPLRRPAEVIAANDPSAAAWSRQVPPVVPGPRADCWSGGAARARLAHEQRSACPADAAPSAAKSRKRPAMAR
jgi:uncharacterized protein YjiS (DUF1127 family)